MKEGTDDVDAQQQHLHLTVSKGWIAALVDIETLKSRCLAKTSQRQMYL
jgi:hypothetical protein